jgi:hypothetical protein
MNVAGSTQRYTPTPTRLPRPPKPQLPLRRGSSCARTVPRPDVIDLCESCPPTCPFFGLVKADLDAPRRDAYVEVSGLRRLPVPRGRHQRGRCRLFKWT